MSASNYSTEDKENNNNRLPCRGLECSKTFSNRSNRDRHEKKVGHTPPPRRSSITVPIFNEELKEYRCPNTNCSVTSKYKSNVTRHISTADCNRKKKVNNKVCPHCQETFTQRSNRDRHVKRFHASEEHLVSQPNEVMETELEVPTFDSDVAEAMNVSFLNDDGSMFERSMTVVDEETPIYQVFEPAMNSSFIGEEESAAIPCDSSATSARSTTTLNDSSATSARSTTTLNNTLDQQFDFVKELKELAKKRAVDHESHFINKVLEKWKEDIKCRSMTAKHTAMKYLIDVFDDSLNDHSFVCWLSKKLDIKPNRFQQMLKNCRHEFVPRNSLSQQSHQNMYSFWLKEENSIISNDRRNGRDVVRMLKSTYLARYGHFDDPNVEEETVTLKKTNTVKKYIKAPRMIYTRSLSRLHQNFLAENPDHRCSLSLFKKNRPFYIERPTEREKQSCLCIVCQNAHTKLQGINTFRKLEKKPPIYSVTEYLKAQANEETDPKLYPERDSKKKVNYYIFEKVLETYVKNGVTKEYTRTTRVDKNESICDVYADFMAGGDKYLYHRSIVDNIKLVIPKMRENFDGKYIEMDFSQNIALIEKNQVQPAHFSGKQQSLHCSILVDESEKLTYIYHLSDDTGHDPIFVNEVLEDIFKLWNIRNETILLKSDNAGNQYKDRFAFASYKNLANKYQVRIIRVYGAAGHGKGLIDAMSSFGVKSILRQDIVTDDVWYKNSEEMCQHLRKVYPERTNGEKFMYYKTINPVTLDSKRMDRPEYVINGCMKQHLFDYKPGKESVMCREFLCDCEQCLNFNFEDCVSNESEGDVATSVCYEDECILDADDEDENRKVYEFVTVPSYVALVSGDPKEPVYIVYVEEKGLAEKEETDSRGHRIPSGDYFLRGKYLKMERSRSSKFQKFSMLDSDVLIEPEEVFDVFVDILDDLTLDKGSFLALMSRADEL